MIEFNIHETQRMYPLEVAFPVESNECLLGREYAFRAVFECRLVCTQAELPGMIPWVKRNIQAAIYKDGLHLAAAIRHAAMCRDTRKVLELVSELEKEMGIGG